MRADSALRSGRAAEPDPPAGLLREHENPLPLAPSFTSNAAAPEAPIMPPIHGDSSAHRARSPQRVAGRDAAAPTASASERSPSRSMLGLGLAFLAAVAAAPAARASEPRELRGVWIAAADTEVFQSRASVAEALEFLARHHVNVVYPDVWYRGVTLHPSPLLEKTFGVRQDPRYAGRDPLAELIVEAHARGIEVIPWFEYGFAASNAAQPTRLLERRPEWAARDQGGGIVEKNGFAWFNSLDPSVQDFVGGLMLEVARGYDVDGVQGDDRLPALPTAGGYDAATVALWHKDKRLSAPEPQDPRWIAWRAGRLTDFLARLARDVRAVAPGMTYSASPSPYRWGLDEYLQDSKTWLERGLVDMFHPQCYRRDLASYAKLADEQRALMPRNARAVYAPGILIQSGNWRMEAEELVRMVEHNRDRGYGGEVLFHYAGLRAADGELARALLAGPYEEVARPPHRPARWRPKAPAIPPRPLPGPEAWSRADGHVRARNAGAAEVVYGLAAPAAGWFQVYVDIPDVGDLPAAVERAFSGGATGTARVAIRPGLVDMGAVRIDGDRGRAELRISTPADEAGRLAVGHALLVIDRKRSPDAVWRD